MRSSTRHRCQHGVTLIEALIVLAVLGIIAGIASFAINSTWQRYRIEAAAGDVRSFVQSTFTSMAGAGAPVFLRLVPGSPNRLEIAAAADGTGVIRRYDFPELINLSMTSLTKIDCDWPAANGTVPSASDTSTPRVLQLDLIGRTLDATGAQVTGVRHLIMTHDDMVEGKLEPRMRYDVRLYPLWYVQLERVKE